ncbi:GPP34 family phosphoprotein [Streptomyces sp. NPDC048516]|uniref:GOLPH3/VPS74 family protein n=1 Tax=Streptomyces sp. NPDC048516 TaxID=3365565 RepID=UPI003720A2F5
MTRSLSPPGHPAPRAPGSAWARSPAASCPRDDRHAAHPPGEEKLLLLALDPVRGRPLNHGAYLRDGPAGAAPADLEGAGRITVEGRDRIVVANPLPLGDPVLDGAPAALPGPDKQRRGSTARRWVRGAGRPVQELCLRRLEERGAVSGGDRTRPVGTGRDRWGPDETG